MTRRQLLSASRPGAVTALFVTARSSPPWEPAAARWWSYCLFVTSAGHPLSLLDEAAAQSGGGGHAPPSCPVVCVLVPRGCLRQTTGRLQGSSLRPLVFVLLCVSGNLVICWSLSAAAVPSPCSVFHPVSAAVTLHAGRSLTRAASEGSSEVTQRSCTACAISHSVTTCFRRRHWETENRPLTSTRRLRRQG